jgi:hypothetical protein
MAPIAMACQIVEISMLLDHELAFYGPPKTKVKNKDWRKI